MGIATLVYTLGDPMNEEKLVSGSLRQVDNCTRSYADEVEMRNGSDFKYRIDNFIQRSALTSESYQTNRGKFKLYFIEDNASKEELGIIYNDPKPIITKFNNLLGTPTKSEVEKARKLLFSSKDKIFLRDVINENWFKDTTGCLIKLKGIEVKELFSAGFKPICKDGEYYLSIENVLEYSLKKQRPGFMRHLIEDALEVWKERLEDQNDDLLYYYSRNLRMSLNDYYQLMSRKKTVTNLSLKEDTILNVINSGRLIKKKKGKYVSKHNKVKTINVAN